MTKLLEIEIQTYNEKLPELLAHAGKFVLIKETEVIDYFDAYADALKVGYEKFDDGVFLVKRIAPSETVAFFTRDIVTECRV
ncbi:hypothetical protein [Ruegeria sp. Ofav3-42]|uniref:hypothetical protein n=1 Tax=Ruegeria sp. Ofav3-42 TaxID=2917759 RepID=UPI001EF3E9A0|nr:hypothetical protein [Ruegeria sp. Ofav3-42]MCG7520505.1 hypothetical protein [Ruegeria sp. Ofav3-42]